MNTANPKPRILVVDDDPDLRELLRDYLGKQDMDVRTVADGPGLRAALAHEACDLLILDVMLPGDDGLALCREIRAKSRLPILMLTARGDELDRIIGLEMGADDYLPKPFHPRELLARVRSILRRAPEQPDGDGNVRTLKFAGWTLDLGARHLVDAEGVVTPLSSGEFRMLNALAESPNRVLSRDQLMDVLAGRSAGPFDRTVDVMISRLRRRLGDDGREPRIIRTLRSEGYVLSVPVEKHV